MDLLSIWHLGHFCHISQREVTSRHPQLHLSTFLPMYTWLSCSYPSPRRQCRVPKKHLISITGKSASATRACVCSGSAECANWQRPPRVVPALSCTVTVPVPLPCRPRRESQLTNHRAAAVASRGRARGREEKRRSWWINGAENVW